MAHTILPVLAIPDKFKYFDQILPVAQTHCYTSRLHWGPMKILLTEVLTKSLHTKQINQPTPKEVKQKFHFWKEQQETHLAAPLINLLW